MSDEEKDTSIEPEQEDEEKRVVLSVKPKKKTPKKREPKNQGEEEKCQVCFEPYTKLARKKVTCVYCKASGCIDCHKNYLMSSVHDPHCMFCKVAWNIEFVRHNFTNHWLVKEYSKIEIQSLWEREKSLLPRTMRTIEKEDFLETFRKEHLPTIRDQAFVLQAQLSAITSARFDNIHDTLNSSTNTLRAIIAAVEKINNLPPLKLTIDREQVQALFPAGESQGQDQVKTRAAFVRPCPAPDCRGFLSTQWMCSICHTKVCAHCHVIKRLGDKIKPTNSSNNENDDTEQDKEKAKENSDPLHHVCKDTDLATAKLIEKETKNCPKCGVSIFKIEGCNQMFCTHCHTAFSWKDMTIINSNIHNPHYFEWLNSRGNGHREAPAQLDNTGICADDQFVNATDLSETLDSKSIAPKLSAVILSFIRVANHIREMRGGYRGRNTTNANLSDVDVNEDLRYSYLKGQINEQHIKSTAYDRYKARRFERPKAAIVAMLHTAGINIVNSIPINHTYINQMRYHRHYYIPRGLRSNFTQPPKIEQDPKFKALVEDVVKQLVELMNYYNESIVKHHELYKSDAHFLIFSMINRGIDYEVVTRKTAINKINI